MSYASADAEHDVLQPYELAKWLEAEGYHVWWDLHMQAGVAQKMLAEKIERAQCVIALYSPHAKASHNVFYECQLAANANKLLPFIIDGTADLLPEEWRGFHRLIVTDFDAQKADILRKLPPPSGKRATVAAPEDARISISALPSGAATFIGREDELARLAAAWASTAPHAAPSQKTNVFVLHAIGGAGKSAILRQFLDTLADQQFAGAAKVYAWSAYSQGSGDNRAASADEFIARALAFFGHDLTRHPIADPVERGRKLASLVAANRSLLILDGLEPLQDMPHINGGRLKDRGLAALIKGLADHNKGLLLITSRQALPELTSGHEPRVISDALDCMTTGEGVKLLAALGVDGKRTEMERAVEEVLGHALSLNLLGTYLSAVHGGDVNGREQFKLGDIEDADADFIGDATARYAKRAACIMEGTIERFEALEGRSAKGGEAETA
ncbi:MAG: toll/interleukin-1 receptor domain-containing protein, partial [Alphaproteobacteria bacterium]